MSRPKGLRGRTSRKGKGCSLQSTKKRLKIYIAVFLLMVSLCLSYPGTEELPPLGEPEHNATVLPLAYRVLLAQSRLCPMYARVTCVESHLMPYLQTLFTYRCS